MAKIPRCSRSYQRLLLRFVLAVVLVAAIVCFGSTWPPTADATDTQSLRLPRKGLLKSQETLVADDLPRSPGAVPQPSMPVSTVSGSLAITTHKPNPGAALDHEMEAAFREVEALFADEYRSKALLSPILETGQPLLRDLTHRVRAFGHIFEIWESLHLAPNDGKP